MQPASTSRAARLQRAFPITRRSIPPVPTPRPRRSAEPSRIAKPRYHRHKKVRASPSPPSPPAWSFSSLSQPVSISEPSDWFRAMSAPFSLTHSCSWLTSLLPRNSRNSPDPCSVHASGSERGQKKERDSTTNKKKDKKRNKCEQEKTTWLAHAPYFASLFPTTLPISPHS